MCRCQLLRRVSGFYIYDLQPFLDACGWLACADPHTSDLAQKRTIKHTRVRQTQDILGHDSEVVDLLRGS